MRPTVDELAFTGNSEMLHCGHSVRIWVHVQNNHTFATKRVRVKRTIWVSGLSNPPRQTEQKVLAVGFGNDLVAPPCVVATKVLAQYISSFA